MDGKEKNRARINVLLVEDNELFAKTILFRLKKLENAEHIAERVPNLKKALNALEKGSFDVALLDLNLPDSQELDTLNAVLEAFPELPVIVLTGMSDRGIAIEAIQKGAQEYLIKTEIEARSFEKTISYAIERQSMTNRLREKSAELLTSEKRFREMIENNIDAVAILDPERKILFINPAGGKLLDKTFSEAVGSVFPISRIDHGYSGLVFIETPSGEKRIADMRAVETQWEGARAFQCSLRDITEKIKLEEKEAELKKIINASPVVTFLWKAEDDWPVEFVSNNITQFGYQPEEFYSGKLKYKDLICEGDRERVVSKSDLLKRDSGELVQEYRIKTKSNETLWINDHTWGRKNKDGLLTHFQGVIFDINDKKAAENALIKAEQEKATILGSISELVIYINSERQILWANRAALESFDKTAEELKKTTICESICKRKGQCANNNCILKKMVMANSTEETEKVAEDGKVWALKCYPVLSEAVGDTVLVAKDITAQKKAESQLQRVYTAVEEATEAIIITDLEGYATYINRAFTLQLGYSLENMKEQTVQSIYSDDTDNKQLELHSAGVWKGWQWRAHARKADGTMIPAQIRSTPIPDKNDIPVEMLFIISDLTQHEKEEEQRKQLEFQLMQAQKLESIGQLAAGIAHEINTPTQFVGDNTNFLQDSFKSIIKTMDAYNELLKAEKKGEVPPDLISQIDKILEEEDVEYLKEEIPEALTQSLGGIERVSKIVLAMKEFSHPRMDEKKAIDINKAIENTLTVSHNEWKYVADAETDFTSKSSMVQCYPGELNQVLLNMFVNAAHTIADANKARKISKGLITVKTESSDKYFKISVSDTGMGIPEEIRPRVFDMFFTTKEVGKGTGQGLSLAYDVIVNKHGGKLTFDSEVGKGTTFHIELPLEQ
jgi:PAS domain S-box-containing protein